MNSYNSAEHKHSGKDMILNLIIIALCIILFFFIIIFVKNVIIHNQEYTVSESTLVSQLRYQNYTSLLSSVYLNEAHNVPKKGDMEQLYAAAYYYENAFMFHAYETTGDREEAQIRYEKMQEYEKQLGEYGFVREEILDFLGIEDVDYNF